MIVVSRMCITSYWSALGGGRMERRVSFENVLRAREAVFLSTRAFSWVHMVMA